MFELVGTFFHQVSLSIGGTLFVVASFFGLSPTEDEYQVGTSSSEIILEEQQQFSDKEQMDVSVKTEIIQKVTTPVSNPQPASVSVDALVKTTLQIENVKSVVDETTASVSWTTTLPSESRLIFDNGNGRVFESESGLGTSHTIQTSNLQESEEYDFKITATTEDKSQYDDYYDTLYAKKKYIITLGTFEKGCQYFLVEDTAGYPGQGAIFKLRTKTYSSFEGVGGAYTSEFLTLESDVAGKMKYCGIADEFRFSREELEVTFK